MVKDADLFAAAMRDAQPLRGRKRPRQPRVTTLSESPPAEGPAKPRERPRPATVLKPRAARALPAPAELTLDDHSFDRDISRSLSRGKLVPQASLDLHGMTLAAAERAVALFLDDAGARDLRVVLIVTGKGLRLQAGLQVGIGLGLRRGCHGALCRPAPGPTLHQTHGQGCRSVPGGDGRRGAAESAEDGKAQSRDPETSPG